MRVHRNKMKLVGSHLFAFFSYVNKPPEVFVDLPRYTGYGFGFMDSRSRVGICEEVFVFYGRHTMPRQFAYVLGRVLGKYKCLISTWIHLFLIFVL